MAAAAGLVCTVVVVIECSLLAFIGAAGCARYLSQRRRKRRRYHVAGQSNDGDNAAARCSSWSPYLEESAMRQPGNPVISQQRQAIVEVETGCVVSPHDAGGVSAVEAASGDHQDELAGLLQIMEERGTELQAELMRRLVGSVSSRQMTRSLGALPSLSLETERRARTQTPPLMVETKL